MFASSAESPDLLSGVKIVLPFTHPTPASAGTVTAKLVDRESDGVWAADDGLSSTDRFRRTPGNFSKTAKPAQVSGTVELDVTQEVRDAITAGKTRLTFRIESDVQTPIRIANGAVRIDILTGRRAGVVADLFGAEGRRLVGGPNASSIIDLRYLPAGKYHIRVFDPFSEASHNLYDASYNPVMDRGYLFQIEAVPSSVINELNARTISAEQISTFTQIDLSLIENASLDVVSLGKHWTITDGSQVFDLKLNGNALRVTRQLNFVVEIEAPKVGEADVQSDRDELRGGSGNDELVGNGYYDRLFGGLGSDRFVGESVEVRDFNYKLPNESPDTITSVSIGQEGYLIARPDDFVITTFADKTLEVAVANKLGLASIDANNTLRLTRPLRATDLSRLVELDADPASLGRLAGGSTPYTLSSLAGLEYAVNLEYLSLARQNVASLARIEPGIRLGREEQGELGLRSLRFIDLDFNPLIVGLNEAYPTTTVGPLHVLGRLSNLEFVSIDNLRGGAQSDTWYDLGFAENLEQLRWLSARNNQITTYQDVFLESSYTGSKIPYGWYPLDQISGNYADNQKKQLAAPSGVIFGGVTSSSNSSPAPGVESRNAGSYSFNGTDAHVAE